MDQQPPSKPCVIDQSHLRRARNLARQSGRSVIDELEQLNNGSPQMLIQQLAALFGMTAFDAAGLARLAPAFDLLPLTLAVRWQCLLLRDDDGALIGVLADPFDPDLQLWLNSQARGTMLMALASHADLATYFLTQAGRDVLPALRQSGWEFDRPAISGAADTTSTRVLEVAGDVLRKAMRR